MKLFLICQTVNDDYDTYDSAVVAAPDVNTAQHMHPGGTNNKYNDWAEAKYVQVKYLGETELAQDVICASFNAG